MFKLRPNVIVFNGSNVGWVEKDEENNTLFIRTGRASKILVEIGDYFYPKGDGSYGHVSAKDFSLIVEKVKEEEKKPEPKKVEDEKKSAKGK